MPHAEYKRVAADLRRRIESGQYRPEDQLPSRPQLMETYGVASNTIARAIAELESAGYVAAEHGVGVFVLDPPDNPPEPPDTLAGLTRRVAALERDVTALQRPRRR